MKSKIVKWVIVSFLVLFLCILIFSALWPAFHKKSKTEDLLPLTLGPENSGVKTERILCVDDNLDALLWRLKIINSATESLDFATFSFNDDRSGRDIMAALYNAADRGVKIRMIVDGLSIFLYLKHSKYFNTLAQHPNIQIKNYNPINLLKPWRINYRMHDKYIIADDNIYILGGRNTKNLSLGNYQEEKDIDRDVVVYNTGKDSSSNQEPGIPSLENNLSSLDQVRNYFENIWSQKFSKIYKSKGKITIKDEEHLNAYYNNLVEDFPLAFVPVNWIEETIPVNKITLLSNPVNNGNKVPVLWDNLNNLIKQGNDILIQTPYIMCNKKMYDDLTEEVQNVEKIRIVTNSVENGANIMGCADFLNQKGKILALGAEVYECNSEHSSHGKTVLIDNNISIIGSFNYDMRSTYIDTELMLVVDSPELNSYLRDFNNKNIAMSKCVHPSGLVTYGDNYTEKNLSKGKKVLYNFLRILTVPARHLL